MSGGSRVGDGSERITEAQVELLLASDLSIVGEPVWTLTHQDCRAELAVHNHAGQNVRRNIRIVRAIPSRYHLVLRWGRTEMRKLDVRDDHRNPDQAREVWELRTHKHRFTDEWGHAWAYTPDDIPDTSNPTASLDEYAEVFDAFAAECGINLDRFTWLDPPIETRERGLW